MYLKRMCEMGRKLENSFDNKKNRKETKNCLHKLLCIHISVKKVWHIALQITATTQYVSTYPCKV